MKTINYLKSHFRNSKNGLVILILMLLVMLGSMPGSVLGQTTVIIPVSTTNNSSGSVRDNGTKSNGNMVNLSDDSGIDSPRGWAHFNLSSIPVGAVVTAAKVNFTTFSSNSSSSNNDIYGFTGDPAAMSGSTLYSISNDGPSFNNSTWVINQAQSKILDVDGINFIQANIGTNNANFGFIRGGGNVYNIYGYTQSTTSLRPTLEVTYIPLCSGTPNAGNTVSSDNAVCSGENFTLSLSISQTAPGITYQWQSATNLAFSAGVTNLGTATTQVTNQTTTKFYRCVVRCSASGLSANSTIISVTMNSLLACYCIPTYPSEVEPITRVQFANILNNTCASKTCSPAYENFTSITGNVTKGNTYLMTVRGNTDGSGTRYIRAWFDWNQNGSLSDAGEEYNIGTITNSTGTDGVQTTLNITIPIGAATGVTLMRVSKKNNGGYPEECNNVDAGQSEDYALNISIPTPCSGTPVPGNTLTTLNPVCSTQSFTLSLQNSFTAFPDITYQWQSSTNGSTYTNVSSSGTSSTYSATISSTLYYRCRVACPTGGAGLSNPIQIVVTPCYCTPSLTSGCSGTGDAITNVLFSNLSNPSSCSANGYSNYYLTTASASVTQGVATPITISRTSNSEKQNVYVWIDFDNDGSCADAGELVYSGQILANAASVTGNILIPNCASVGARRMRVRMEFNSITDPCANIGGGTLGSGETEDYSVTVNAATVVPPLSSTLTGPSSATCNNSGTYILNPGYSGSIAWQYSTVSSAGPFTDMAGVTTPSVVANFITIGPGDYHVRAKFTGLGCTPDVFSNVISTVVTSPVVNFNTSTPSVNICRGQQVTITSNSAGPFSWNTGATTSSISVNPVLSTAYSIVTGTGVCQGHGNITLNVIGGPVATAGLADVAIECPNSNKQLMANQVNSTPGSPVTFSGGALTIVDDDPANPYPSNLAVSGLTGINSIANIKINGLTHSYPTDLDIALVAPNGSKVLLMADNGSGTNANGIAVTFQDGAPNLPNTSNALTAGTYRTTTNTSWSGSSISGPFGSLLSSFTGSFNGTWKLYVFDDENTDAGSISSWSITFNTQIPFTYNGPVTYTWKDQANNIVSTIANPIVTPQVPTTYTLTIADNSCSSTSSVLANVLPMPSVGYTTDLSNFYCESQTINFNASGSGVNNGGPAVAGSLTVTVSGVANLDETSWQIRSNTNVLIASGGGNNVYAFGSTNVHTVNPALSAYPVTFIIETNGSFGDNIADFNVDCSVGNYSLISGSVGNFDGPGETFTSPILSCIQGGGAGLDYVWNGPNGFYSIAEDPSIYGSQISHSGDYTVTVIDANGCNASQTQYVEVNPNPAVNITTTEVSCPGLNDAIATFDIITQPSYNDYAIIEGSNVGNFNPQVFTGYSEGFYFYQVTELNTGCTSFGAFNVTTVPNVAPAITLSANNTTVECDGSGNVSELNAWLASNGGADAFDACGSVIWSNDFTSMPSNCGSTVSVTFTAIDDQNATASTTASFTIVDTTVPVIDTQASNSTVECDGAGNLAAFNNWIASKGGASASDACAGVTWTNDFQSFPNSCSAAGTVTVNFTATDICGNASVTTASFTIVDTTPPSISAASNSTVECNGFGNNNALNAWLSSHGGANASDLCSGSVTWTDNFSGLSNPCGATGSATVTFTATDGCGNATSTTASFTIVDTTPPAITAAFNSTVECNGFGNNAALNSWLATKGGATASDICSGNVTWSNDFSGLSNLCGATGSASVTFTATDDCGNASSTTASFTIVDTTPPSITAASNSTVECNGSGNNIALNMWLSNHGGAIGSDICSGSVTWSNDFVSLSTQCGATGTTSVTFTATDACGNATSTTASFTIVDTTPPAITAASNSTVECNGVGNNNALNAWLSSHGGATASDVCSGSVLWTNDFAGLSNPCGATGSASVTFTATDDCGNASTTMATFTIVDTTPPAITAASSSTLECNGSGNTSELNDWLANNGGATASDICSGVTWSNDFTSVSNLCGSTGSATVTFTATDDCGNASSSTATFTIVDTTSPSITAASNSTIECNGIGNTGALNVWLNDNGGATASDICSGVTWSNDFTSLSDLCGATGSATVTFTATDDCGNASSSTAIFTIVDTTPPSIVCPADITLNNTLNQCGTNVNYNASASDICSGSATIAYSIAPGSFFAIGTTQVNVSATDDCGNVSNCSFNVIVNDNQLPAISCAGNINVSNTPGLCGAIVNYSAPVASDNCNYNVTQTNGLVSGDVFPIGVTVNTFEVTDASGNSTSCSFSVTVNDTQAPYLAAGSNCPSNKVACNPVSWAPPVFIDNCPGVQVTSTHVPGSNFPIGTTLVTYTATDVVGLISTCSFSITVLDTSLAADSIDTNRDYDNICAGGDITLTVKGGHLGLIAPGVPAQWKWYRGGCGIAGGGIPVGTGLSITVAPIATTTYYVRAEGGCHNSACISQTVVVSIGAPSGTPAYSSVPPQGAPGVTGVLSVAPVAGATFYQWFTNNGHINSVLFNGNLSPEYTSGPSVNISFVIPEQNYQIRVIAGNACGRTNQTNTHIRGTVAAPTSMTGPTQVCPGAPVTYTIPPIPPVSGNSPVTYSWTLVPSTAGTITVSPNGLTATVNFAVGFGSAQVCANGISSFGLPGTPYCTSVSSSAPIPGAISGNSMPCSGNTVPEIYSILPVSGAVTYGWSCTVPGAIVVPAPNGLSAAVSFPVGSFTGSVRVTASSGCGTSAPSVFNVTNGVAGIPGDINGATGGLCNVQDVSFNLLTTNALSYQWSVSSNMSIDGPGSNNSVIVDFLPGFTTGIVTVQANYACGSVIKTHAVSGAPSPAVIVDADVCPNTAQTYFLTNIEPSTVYTWTASGDVLDEYCTFGNCSQYFLEVGSGGGSFTIVASNSCGIAAPVFSGSNCRVAGGSWTDAKVYPNPSTGVINIDFSSVQDGKFQVTISDLSGRAIMANDMQATMGHNHETLDLTSLNAGIYVLQLKDSGTGSTSIFRIVIE